MPITLTDRLLRGIIEADKQLPSENDVQRHLLAMAHEILTLRGEVKREKRRRDPTVHFAEITNEDSELVNGFITKFNTLCVAEHVPAACVVVVAPKGAPSVSFRIAGHKPTIEVLKIGLQLT